MPRAPEERERFHLLFNLRETVDLLTVESDNLEDIWLNHPAEYVALGLMLRCQRLVRGMAALVENHLIDCSATLIRPLLESAITGLWLVREGDSAVSQLMGYDRKETRRAIQAMTGEKPDDLGLYDYAITFWFGVAEDKPFVSIKERSGNLYPYVRNLYFTTHSWIHATTQAGSRAFIADEMEKEPNRFMGLRPKRIQEMMLDALCISLLLGRALDVRLGWNHEGMFDELLEGFGADPKMIEASK